MYWLHVEDFIEAYIGPFKSGHAAAAHYIYTNALGNSAALLGISIDAPTPIDYILSPEENLKACNKG